MRYRILIAVLIIGFFACSKGGDTPIPTPTPTPNPPVVVVEPSLTAANAVVIDIDPGPTNYCVVIGTSQKMEVKLAAMPASGVTIVTNLTKIGDVTNTPIFTNSISSTSLINQVTITGLVVGVPYMLSVVVTSKITPSNTKTIEFKLAAK